MEFKESVKYIPEVFKLAFEDNVKRSVKYVDDKFTVKVTRQGKLNKNSKQLTFIVTFGKPNYQERKFIKECKKAGEKFPIREPQLYKS